MADRQQLKEQEIKQRLRITSGLGIDLPDDIEIAKYIAELHKLLDDLTNRVTALEKS